MINNNFKTWLVLPLGILLAACASPAARIDDEANNYGFERQTVLGTKFFHRIYLNHKTTDSRTLHVYIEGDGLAWLTPNQVSPDPTPHNPLMLSLMAQDKNQAIYLGRPCYFGLARVMPCHPKWWTDARFAPEIVGSMAFALKNLVSKRTVSSVVLIGHSGGGALATLLADRYPSKITAVVTIAANLDTDAWTDKHRWSKLSGSLNPANIAPLNKDITQLHFQGGKDENIPPNLATRFAAKQHQAQFTIYPEFDHVCCWKEKWSDLLQLLSSSSKTLT